MGNRFIFTVGIIVSLPVIAAAFSFSSESFGYDIRQFEQPDYEYRSFELIPTVDMDRDVYDYERFEDDTLDYSTYREQWWVRAKLEAPYVVRTYSASVQQSMYVRGTVNVRSSGYEHRQNRFSYSEPVDEYAMYSDISFYAEIGKSKSEYFMSPLFWEYDAEVEMRWMPDVYRASDGSWLMDDLAMWGSSVHGGVRGGVGRIKMVQDARQALFLLDALKRRGRLARDPSVLQIEQFGYVLCRLHNERFFDVRRHDIAAVTVLDSMLVAENLVLENDAAYLMTVADAWYYGNKFKRASGQRLRMGPRCRFSHDTDGLILDYLNMTPGWEVQYSYERPVGNAYQLGLHLGVDADYVRSAFPTDTWEVRDEYLAEDYDLTARVHAGWYPSMRTHFYLKPNFRISYKEGENKTDSNLDSPNYRSAIAFSNRDWNTGLDIGCEYYYSPRCLLTLNYGYTSYGFGRHTDFGRDDGPYIWGYEQSKSNSVSSDHDFKLGMTYSIF